MINLALLCIFALQHSIMARTAFKRGWSKVIPKAAERSTYILMTCFALIAIFVFWQPLATPIWEFSNTATGTVLSALFWVGWLVGLDADMRGALMTGDGVSVGFQTTHMKVELRSKYDLSKPHLHALFEAAKQSCVI